MLRTKNYLLIPFNYCQLIKRGGDCEKSLLNMVFQYFAGGGLIEEYNLDYLSPNRE